MVTSRSLAEMQPAERRKGLVRAILRIALTWVVVLGAFCVLPIGNESSANAIVRAVIDFALIAAVIIWQVSRVARADVPELRAIEALGVILVVFLVLFASLYLAMSHASGSTFTQRLDHMRALYFTMTVFSTVGFGDITPTTDSARAVVSLQMLFDLILIGAVARLLITAARTGLNAPIQS